MRSRQSRSSHSHLYAVSSLGALLAAALAGGAASCGGDSPDGLAAVAGGDPAGSSGSGADPGVYSDFPGEPVIEEGLPDNVAELFGGDSGPTTGGPCLSEPSLDAMVPKNWTPLLFEWAAPAEQNVFELRLHVDNQESDLVVYTTQPTFAIDAMMWKALTTHSSGRDIELTLRGATVMHSALTAGPFTGASGVVHLAPVEAPGSVVYWTSSDNTSFQGFTIGDPAPVTVLTPPMAGPTSTGGETTCVSCHTSSPDGQLVLYSRDADDGTRAIDVRTVSGAASPAPQVVSEAALALLGRPTQTAPVMSPAHYGPDEAVAISAFASPDLTPSRFELVWTDLFAANANGWGMLARDGDPRPATSPNWRHDGSAIAYVSSDKAYAGVVAAADDGGTIDIYTVPYNDRAGGVASPLPGASDPAYREYYPVYSPNDALLAFNRTADAESSYNQPAAEVFVLPGQGGTPHRLSANDPPQCTGRSSPGLTNSWPRWAPSADAVDGRRYYWLVFSSKRRAASTKDGALLPQLYIAAVVTKVEDGIETLEKDFPAVYVASQIPNQSNHTPAWDYFDVAAIPK